MLDFLNKNYNANGIKLCPNLKNQFIAMLNGEIMTKTRSLQFCIVIYFFIFVFPFVVYSQQEIYNALTQEFDLSGFVSQQTQYFQMESKMITYSLEGKRVGTDIFRLQLKYTPAKNKIKELGKYTCICLSLQLGNSPEVDLPALRNWTYIFNDTTADKKEQVFGIDHGKFENLIDSEGKALPFDKAYHVYNVFIDFHAFCNVFAERTNEGKGIQDLKKINQKIVHDAAFSEPPTNLGKNIAKGSFFKNGKITLEFKGMSKCNDKQCALIGIDSGNSNFKMIMNPTADMEIITIGSSHYKGDIYKDHISNWVQKVTFDEMVVCETTLPMPPNKINSVVERNIIIKNITQE